MDLQGGERERTREPRGWTWRLARITGGLFALLIILSLAGLAYQSWATVNDRERYQPPGKLVDVGGHRLHIVCSGTGSPTVILEAALGGTWLDWALVYDDVAAYARVCAYDRAGLGWSERVQGPLDSSQVADSLHALLDEAGVTGPYVLVGHSIGGVHVRAFAERYSEDVAGIVLIDSSHERQRLRLPAELVEADGQLYRFLSLCRLVEPFGVARLVGFHRPVARSAPLSASERAMYMATMNRTGFCRSLRNDLVTAQAETSQSHPPRDLGDTPLTVLTAGIGLSEADREELPPSITDEVVEEATETWMALQRELVELSRNGTQIMAEESEHYVQYEQPDLVADAIREMVMGVRE